MKDLHELVERFIIIKCKNLLLTNRLKDLNYKNQFDQTKSMVDSTSELCISLLKEIDKVIKNTSKDDLIEVINILKRQNELASEEYYDYYNFNFYKCKAYSFIINYLSESNQLTLK